MRRSIFSVSVSLLALAAITITAVAQESRVIYKFSDLRGRDVRNSSESLGDVEDIVANVKTGDIAYFALSHGETLGFGGKLFAISPRAIALSSDGKHFMLDATSQSLKDAKGFDANQWPNEPDLRWGKETRPAKKLEIPEKKLEILQKKGTDLMRLSRLQGMNVRSNQGEDIGKLSDFGIDLKNDQVAYAAVSHGATLGIGGKLFAVPCSALHLRSTKLDPSRRELVIEMTKADFEKATGFKSGDTWPQNPDPHFKK